MKRAVRTRATAGLLDGGRELITRATFLPKPSSRRPKRRRRQCARGPGLHREANLFGKRATFVTETNKNTARDKGINVAYSPGERIL
jgi:hypothetical protein